MLVDLMKKVIMDLIKEMIVVFAYVFAVNFLTRCYLNPSPSLEHHGLRRNLSFACCPFLQEPRFERTGRWV